MGMIYRYKTNARIRASAQVAGEVCEEIARNGNLTPKALVDASRPEDAPLHGEFEWNDSVAAERYRETQASHIIRCIEVVPEQTEHPVRAFISLPTPDAESEDGEESQDRPKQSYHSINVVMRSRDNREVMLAQAFRELVAIRRKYVGFIELADVFEAIDALANKRVA